MIPNERRFVLDTNVFVSAFLFSRSVPGLALRRARDAGRLLMSSATLAEFTNVLFRPKFDKYLTLERRRAILDGLEKSIRLIDATTQVADCRDPGDNKFLALALDGRASCIVTGDPHLLELHPWRGVPILTPRAFLVQAE